MMLHSIKNFRLPLPHSLALVSFAASAFLSSFLCFSLPLLLVDAAAAALVVVAVVVALLQEVLIFIDFVATAASPDGDVDTAHRCQFTLLHLPVSLSLSR